MEMEAIPRASDAAPGTREEQNSYADTLSRLRRMVGADATREIQAGQVFVFGLGGAGGLLARTLARSGVSRLTLLDADVVEADNLNREPFTWCDVGRTKVAVIADQLRQINPAIQVDTIVARIDSTTDLAALGLDSYDVVVDAIDDFESKLRIIDHSTRLAHARFVTCMGAGNKIDLTQPHRIVDIADVHTCLLGLAVKSNLARRYGITTGVAAACSYAAHYDHDLGPGQNTGIIGNWGPMYLVASAVLADYVLRQLVGGDAKLIAVVERESNNHRIPFERPT